MLLLLGAVYIREPLVLLFLLLNVEGFVAAQIRFKINVIVLLVLLRWLIFEVNAKVDIFWSNDLIICSCICIDLVFLSIGSEEISVLVDDYLFNALRQDDLDGVGHALHHLQVNYLLSDY